MAIKNKKPNPIGFQLKKITTEQFAIVEEAYNNAIEHTSMSISLRFGLNYADRFVASFVKVQFEQNDKAFLVIEVANHFSVNEASWLEFEKASGHIVLPRGFVAHLVMLTVGTLRGVLHCKTENSVFNQFILPTINVMELITEDVELSE